MSDTNQQPNDQTLDFYPQKQYFMDESKSDVVFLVEGKRVPAIKIVLSVQSRYFETMFSSHFSEKNKEVIPMPDTSFDAFKAVIWWLYSHELSFVPELDSAFVAEVSRLADMYLLPRLIQMVGHYLQDKVSMDSLMFLSEFVAKHQHSDLRQHIKQFVERNLNELMAKDMNFVKCVDRLSDGCIIESLANRLKQMEKRIARIIEES